MSLALWIIRGLLALLFLAAGLTKLGTPPEALRTDPKMAWARAYSPNFVRFLGAAEAVGALGLVLPQLLGIAPWLGGLAALGLALIMVGAFGVHLRAGERLQSGFTLAIFALSVFLASQSGIF